METAMLFGIFFGTLLVGMTGYSLYTAFGQPSKHYVTHLKIMKISFC